MNIFKKNEKNENHLPLSGKVRKGYRYYCSLVAAVACCKILCKRNSTKSRMAQ